MSRILEKTQVSQLATQLETYGSAASLAEVSVRSARRMIDNVSSLGITVKNIFKNIFLGKMPTNIMAYVDEQINTKAVKARKYDQWSYIAGQSFYR